MTYTSTPTPNINIALDKNIVDASQNQTLWIKVNVSAAGLSVRAKIYNLTGEYLRELNYITVTAGWNMFEWDLRNTAGKVIGQGMYFVRIESQGATVIRKVFILK